MNIRTLISRLELLAARCGDDVDVTCAKDVPNIRGREPRVVWGESGFRTDVDFEKGNVERIQI